MKLQSAQETLVPIQPEYDYMNGAAVIDEYGMEVLITEEMINNSLKEILKACEDSTKNQ